MQKHVESCHGKGGGNGEQLFNVFLFILMRLFETGEVVVAKYCDWVTKLFSNKRLFFII